MTMPCFEVKIQKSEREEKYKIVLGKCFFIQTEQVGTGLITEFLLKLTGQLFKLPP